MTAIKFMTWNVENLYKPADDASASKISKYQNKLDLLAQTILRLNPDVIAFQEVGGDDSLKDLQRELAGGYPGMAISGMPDRRGIRVAFLSKMPIDEEEEVVDFPPGPALDINRVSSSGDIVPVDRMGRGALRIRVTKNGHTFDTITAHLKSKLLTYPRPGSSSFTPRDEEERAQTAGIALMRRSAEAVTLRIYINNLIEGNNTTPLLLMGDFNDVPDAQTSLILCGPDGSEINTRGFNRRDRGDDTR
ncbi:MAG: endonuclease/exonuclease/phosphatase family protein, partial [candidate division Zixibacteria bacterium]|nr:endonuclease/exonuclease/phosphatase family protein [candidate division Zixibacteria bacterium]